MQQIEVDEEQGRHGNTDGRDEIVHRIYRFVTCPGTVKIIPLVLIVDSSEISILEYHQKT